MIPTTANAMPGTELSAWYRSASGTNRVGGEGKALISVPLLVTESAIEAGALRPMAIHAASHRDVRLLEQAVSFRNFAMAGFATRARVQMVLVAKENVTRNLV